ncbi:hypothetical protein GCM10020358_49310 [Amorphoplanes nipponensis]|uniref:Uncharacterized protein n=1 Tax=Actinoplanes nipponensis TaxID=135950 RepID=A0A919JLC9_9ACTN|nr:hypothetical protein [Actinoplanes nipponensis]GIE53144.1 hypothetical protein Ani05nite_66780 [Actinoplanes nipponensis]
MINLAVRSQASRYTRIVAAAFALGLLAFVSDSFDAGAGQVLTALTSSGLAWGLAAFLAGRTAIDRRSAVIGATVLLVSATLVYYLLILVVSRRWSGGYLADGSSADLYGLRSVAIMTAAWLVASLIAGPMLGLLGHTTRAAPTRGSALAAGIVCGLLSGQVWQEITVAQSHSLQAAADILDGEFVPGLLAATLIQISLPLAVLAWLAHVQRLWRAWPTLLIAMISTASLSALLWQLLRDAANRFG